MTTGDGPNTSGQARDVTAPDARGVTARNACDVTAGCALAVLVVLLLVCAASGLYITRGIGLPPDLDALRDVGFTQGLLDHNWFGDQEYAHVPRYYPPLIPALAAFAARLLTAGRELPALWVGLGPWVNLLCPLACFFAVRRLFASNAVAATATAVFVLFNGALVVPWLAGGYTPWLLTPLLAQAAFFASLQLIAARVPPARWADAVWIGGAIGLTFLAHIIPALLLSAMLLVGALVVHGLRLRTVLWLALCGVVQSVLMAVYAAPLLLSRAGAVVNQTPGTWTPTLLEPTPNAWLHLAIVNAPGVLAGAAAWWLRRRAPVATLTWAMLATWVGVCIVFLLRQETCSLMPALDATAACRVARMPAHHFHLYLQLAWAVLLGYALWNAATSWASTPARRRVAVVAGLAVFVVAAGLLPFRKYDRAARADALATGAAAPMDLAAYDWVLAQTSPDATFVTATPADPALGYDQAVFTVMAAGRKLVAVGALFSNPYVDWAGRDALRRQFLSSLSGGACVAPPDDGWALLPSDFAVDPARATGRFHGAGLAAYRMLPCAS